MNLFCLLALPLAAPATDWLLDPTPYKAAITQRGQDLVLANGLARRVLRVAPNAASVELQNLTSGEHLLRAVSPEARVQLNGVDYAIGGLQGQPVANYLKAAWLDGLKADPSAYRLKNWEVGPTLERFAWQPRREWLSRDLPWPPPGQHLTLHFLPPAQAPDRLAAPVLLDEDFTAQTKLKPDWTVVASRKHPRSSFVNEGKAGEILALPDTSVYAERPWPAGAASAELLVDAGDDTLSNAWGPGLALVSGKQSVQLIIRPNQQVFEWNGQLGGHFDRAQPVRLRIRLAGGDALLEGAPVGQPLKLLATVPCAFTPQLLRVGKVGRNGLGGDYPDAKGEGLMRAHVQRLTVRAAEPANQPAAPPRADLPEIDVHYELYDGLPAFSKWLVVRNTTAKPVRVQRFVAEELRLAEPESAVNAAPTTERPNLHVETDYTFGDMDGAYANPAVKLVSDPDYPTQVHYSRQTPCLLRCEPPAMGPDAEVAPGGNFESFRVFDLLLDSSERERRTLAQRRLYRTLAPWTQQNPLMFHKVGSDAKTIRAAIDQASEAGFEMIIMSFGSGFNFESTDPKYLALYKQLADEARAKGLVLGGYSLLASRGAATAADNTQGQPALYGVMPCLGARWGQEYLAKLKAFCEQAGLGILEHDGSYPGDRCAATNHPGHRGLADSQWVNWRAITDFYKWCTGHGVYLNIPDWYFLAGGTKAGMGYRETNWSLPRAEQELIERQNMYDGTWSKTSSMGWMFVPLSQYHGGGAAATIEPLKDHLDHYEARLANLLGYGVQACYRGPRLFDCDETKAVVKRWVDFYKQHRQVLDGDIIHLRRANGLDWDGILHVNPGGAERGLAMLYNPLETVIEREIRLPLYYTGLSGRATLVIDGGAPRVVELARDESATLKLTIPGRRRTWVLVTP